MEMIEIKEVRKTTQEPGMTMANRTKHTSSMSVISLQERVIQEEMSQKWLMTLEPQRKPGNQTQLLK